MGATTTIFCTYNILSSDLVEWCTAAVLLLSHTVRVFHQLTSWFQAKLRNKWLTVQYPQHSSEFISKMHRSSSRQERADRTRTWQVEKLGKIQSCFCNALFHQRQTAWLNGLHAWLLLLFGFQRRVGKGRIGLSTSIQPDPTAVIHQHKAEKCRVSYPDGAYLDELSHCFYRRMTRALGSTHPSTQLLVCLKLHLNAVQKLINV